MHEEHRRAMEARRRNRLREEHGDVGMAVLDILIRYGPGFLIRIGAPAFQYTTEAGPICQRLPESQSPEDVARIVYEVMSTKISERIANLESRYDQMGQEIWEAWRVTGGASDD